MKYSLDLGCGPAIKNPFDAEVALGVDITPFDDRHIRTADLAKDLIPWDSDKFDYVVCTDFLEHIPRTGYRVNYDVPIGHLTLESYNPFLHLMSEVYRVLKPGGLFQAKTPALPYHEAFQDPTHVNFITQNTVDYFVKGKMVELGNQYGFVGQFDLQAQYWDANNSYHLVWELIKA